MKFLTLLKFKPLPLGDPKMIIAINEGTKAWIKGGIASGKLESAYNVIPNAAGYYGVGIGNFSSAEEAFAFIATYPGYLITDFELYPLSDVYQAVDDLSNAIRKMTGG